MKNAKNTFTFILGVLLTGTILGGAVAIFPGCGALTAIGTGGAIGAAVVAGSQNYQAPGSAKSAVDPINPEFGGVTEAATGGASSITLSWSAATDIGPAGPITYRVFYSATSTDEATIIAEGTQATVVDATSLAISSLTPGTTYNFVVRAEDPVGNTDGNSQQLSARTNLSFGGVTSVTSRTASVLRASWTAATGAPAGDITYTAYASSTSSAVADLLASTTVATSAAGATTVDITGLNAGTVYNILVRANTSDNTEGATANTAVSSGRTRLSFGGATGTTVLSASSLRVSWSAATGAAAGDITYTASASSASDVAATIVSSPSNTAVSAAGATSVDITGLTSNTEYNIVVRATTSNNDEGTVSPNTVVSDPTRTRLSFAGITSLATTTTSTQLTANWAAPPVIASGQTITYTTHVAADPEADDTAQTVIDANTVEDVDAIDTTSADITGLTPDTRYSMVVRAVAASPTNSEDGNTAVQRARTPLTFAGATELRTTNVTVRDEVNGADAAEQQTSSGTLDIRYAAASGQAAGSTRTYRVYISTSSTASEIVAAGNRTTSVTAVPPDTLVFISLLGDGSTLSAGTEYNVIVRAIATDAAGDPVTDAEEDGNGVIVTQRTAPSISGTITAGDGTTGDFLVFLVDTNENIMQSQIVTPTNNTATYTFQNVTPGTATTPRNYRVRVARDTDGNRVVDGGEPTGNSNSVENPLAVTTTNRTGVNITVTAE